MQDREIEKTSSEVVYQNKWMRVREDRIVRADGSRGIYGVVEKPDFAVVAAVDGGCIHLVEQFRYPVGARFWELPQGSWERSEPDPRVLAAAELREETGLVARSMIHAGHLLLACGFSDQGYDVFFATDLQRRDTRLDPEEQGLVSRGFPVTEFEKMIGGGVIQDATTVAAYALLRLKGFL